MVKRCVKNAVNLDSGAYLDSLIVGGVGVVKRLVKKALNLGPGAYLDILVFAGFEVVKQ